MKILWADDEIELLKPHIIFLESKGYSVNTVNNGVDALDRLKEDDFDLVFLDENMPGLGGLDVLKELKELQPSLPVVMITKNEEEHIMEDAIGSKIEDYLIKPVHPKQMLLTIKRVIDNKRLVTEKVTSNYQQAFREIMMQLMEGPGLEELKSIYKKIVFYELAIQNSDETGMEEVLETQKTEMNREFSKYIRRNYMDFLRERSDDTPVMSHNLMHRKVIPEMKNGKPVFFVLVDNLRFDQWKFLQPMIEELFRVRTEDMYLSILPTTTQYCRNSIFAGMLPSEIEKEFRGKWLNDEDEGGKNQFEELFASELLKRLRIDAKLSYNKILNLQGGKDLVEQIPNLFDNDLNIIVYNFVDALSHARTDFKIVRELAEDEAAYRSLTLSWFEHSPLYDALKKIAEQDATVIITTDHGSVRVNEPVKIIGDRKTTTNLRYKTGKNLSYDEKGVFTVPKPQEAGLPTQHISSRFVFCQENDFFVYPNNLNHYAKYYRDTFQHGGISVEEMLIPFIVLNKK